MDKINEYLKMTGQTEQELFAGMQFYGLSAILEMVDEALESKKKIIYKDEPDIGIGAMSFTLENI